MITPMPRRPTAHPLRPLIALLLALSLVAGAHAQQALEGTVAAPDFPLGIDWLNTERPLTMTDLVGKVVVLDFWTYGCINCIHMIPVLKRLEAAYPDELVVIGVHSGKFDNERETDNIRTIVSRYELEHPVVNDADFDVWRTFGVQAWPTFLVIDPVGRVVGSQAGEAPFELLDEVVGRLVATFEPRGQIDRSPLPIGPDLESFARPLRFPGKVLADADGGRLFISDTNHDRIVVTDLEGNVLDIIGNGRPDLVDGGFADASFQRPQGLTLLDAETLIVADTENHALRLVDLSNRSVTTIAGTGEQVYMRYFEARAAEVPLNSPWDVEAVGGQIYIAMAGQHQLYALDLATGVLRLHAGSGREQLTDGPNLEGGLNQPSGLASDGDLLYFADSEASAIRSTGLGADGDLRTLIGLGLFEFGDIDGVADEVRLQHPLGIELAGGALLIADTYNHKIKRLDPDSLTVTTLAGGDEDGYRDGDVASGLLDEPGGVSAAGERLFIADTNNHTIRVLDLGSGALSTLELSDPQGLLLRPASLAGMDVPRELAAIEVAPGTSTLRLVVELPENYQINDLAPFSATFASDSDGVAFGASELSVVEPSFPLEVEVTLAEGEHTVRADLVIYYCSYDAVELCLIEQVVLELPLSVRSGASDLLEMRYAVPSPFEPDRF
jgi:thiol-disulfide isomerase/thioredoxin